MSRALVLSRLLVVAVVLVVLTGCRETTPPGTLVLLVRASKLELPAWQEAVKTFSEGNKTPVVVRSAEGAAYAGEVDKALSGKSAADVVMVDSTDLPRLRQQQMLVPLDKYVQSQEDLKLSDFFLTVMQPYRGQGGTLALPTDINIQEVAFNLDHFELLHLQTPKATWTWEDYLKCAQALTTEDDSGKRTWGTALCPNWQIYVWQSGGDVVDNPQNPQRSTLSTSAAQAGLQFLADLVQKHKVAPSPSRVPAASQIEAFVGGQVSMIYVDTHGLLRINQAKDMRWGLLPAPRGKMPGNIATGSGLAIPKTSRQADLAWKLLGYLAGSEGQKKLLGSAFSMPPLEYLANSEYFGAVDSTGHNPFVESVADAHQLPLTPQYAQLQKIWDEELPALWDGKATVQTVTQRIDERANKVLAGQ